MREVSRWAQKIFALFCQSVCVVKSARHVFYLPSNRLGNCVDWLRIPIWGAWLWFDHQSSRELIFVQGTLRNSYEVFDWNLDDLASNQIKIELRNTRPKARLREFLIFKWVKDRMKILKTSYQNQVSNNCGSKTHLEAAKNVGQNVARYQHILFCTRLFLSSYSMWKPSQG